MFAEVFVGLGGLAKGRESGMLTQLFSVDVVSLTMQPSFPKKKM